LSDNLKKALWALLKPAIVAMVVALLVSLGVQMTQSGPQFQAAGTTHFTNLAITGDASVAGTLSVAGGHTYAGLVGATNGLTCATNITGTSSSGSLRYAAAVISTTLDTNAISVTSGITGATLALSGNAAVTGVVKVGTFLQYASVTTQTVVNTQPITPTGTYQHIAAAVAVYTNNLIRAGALTGQLWILQNIGTPSITITDDNTCNLNATYAMGISDTLGLMFDGTTWVEIFRTNN